MRLCTIISTWADTLCLLPYCIENHLAFADGVIVMWSEMSNHGVKDARMKEFVNTHKYPNVYFHKLEPMRKRLPKINEREKRNVGIYVAGHHLFTHFILADADEFYDPKQVQWEKAKFNKSIEGLVCGLKVYIKHPTLRTDEPTLLPFIHKLTPKIQCVENYHYPFAVQGRVARIDPTRRLNITSGVHWSEIVMHHMSYVRNDISLKINNSTANLRGNRATIESDLSNARPGYVSRLYGRPLEECENKFNLPMTW